MLATENLFLTHVIQYLQISYDLRLAADRCWSTCSLLSESKCHLHATMNRFVLRKDKMVQFSCIPLHLQSLSVLWTSMIAGAVECLASLVSMIDFGESFRADGYERNEMNCIIC